MEFILFTSVFIIVLVAYQYFEDKEEKERVFRISKLAVSLSYRFSPSDDPALHEKYKHFKFYGKGNSRKIKNVVQAKINGIDITLSEFIYTISHGKGSSIHYNTVVGFPSGETPEFILWPEGIVDKVYSLFGYQDIDFDSHPRFSSNYVLQCDEEFKLRTFFVKGALDYFDRNPGHQIQVKGGFAVMVIPGRQGPAHFLEEIKKAITVWESIN